MKKISILIFSLFLVIFAGCSQETSSELSQAEIDALIITLEDEYKAEMIYQNVLEKFGSDTRPFSNIINAEVKHSTKLIELFEQFNLDVPVNDFHDKVPIFDSVPEACTEGVQAEIDNAALYDNLFDSVENEDIIRVFTSLRDASIDKHLPAFERCSN